MKTFFAITVLAAMCGIAQAQDAKAPAAGITAESLIGRYEGTNERGQPFGLIISKVNGNEVQGAFVNNAPLRNRTCSSLAVTGKLQGKALMVATDESNPEGCPSHRIRFLVSDDGRQLDGEIGKERQRVLLTR